MTKSKKNKKWYEYLWIASSLYLFLGLFNILFAWLGLLCFFIPLLISIIKGNKSYCNKYCGRGQLFEILGNKVKYKRRKMPDILKSKYFRYGFLIFFLYMFTIMLYSTYRVFAGMNSLKEGITILWTFYIPWEINILDVNVLPWIKQFAYGFYSVMLTSTILGLISMIVYKPRSWCVYCPMGTMTQSICKIKNNKNI